jgi:outer membrane protein OmpA-like peptidoglycan-associated protein
MRLKKMALVVATFVFFANSAIADDVMIDLSVLDEITPSSYSDDTLLFPVLPKQEKPKVKPIITKKAVKKTKPVVKNVNKPKKDTIKTEILPEVESTQSQEEVVVVDVEPTIENLSADANVEPIIAEKNIENSILQKKENDNIVDKSAVVQEQKEAPLNTETAKLQESILQTTNPTASIETSELKDTLQSNAQKDTLSEGTSEVSVENEKIEAEKPQLLIENTPTTVNVISETKDNMIVFADDSDVLTDEMKAKIDTIVSGFANERTNKIAIDSYNLDDGVDTFRKKRISLNRAIEIRSYLMQKGFKNFSIRVVNINSDSDNINAVEIKEI